MKQSIIAITLVAILFSCNKSDEYPVRLISTSYQVVTYPMVYTKFGEITNRTIIDKYINTPAINYFYLSSDTTVTAANDTITYESRDTVLFSLPGNWGKRIARSTGQYIYFYMIDTLIGYKGMDNVLNNIANNIGIVKPYYKDACPVFNSGCFIQSVYDAFIATGSRQELELPLLTYKITRGSNGFYTGLARMNYNNVFDNSVLNLLQEGDTLAIQTSKRVYTR